MTTAQAVKTSVIVNNNSPIQDYVQSDDLNSTYFWNDSWVQTFHKNTTVLSITACDFLQIYPSQLKPHQEKNIGILSWPHTFLNWILSLKAEFVDYLPKGEGSSEAFGCINVTVKQTTEKADYRLTVLSIADSKVGFFNS